MGERDVDVRVSRVHGQGVFATRRFHPGERILRIDDSRIVTPESPLNPEKAEFDHHQDYLGTHDVLMQEPERYINHCCEPNTYVRTFDGVRWVVAYRGIAPGDEITYDYCINSYGDGHWSCNCGHERCRKTHNVDFFELPDDKLVEYLPLLDQWFVDWRREAVDALAARLADRFVNPSQ